MQRPIPVRVGEVHLWITPTGVVGDPRLSKAYESLLAPDEILRYRAIRDGGARAQYLATRALVRTALSQHALVEPQAWVFRKNDYGRPDVVGRTDLRFNASNCEELVVCAVTKDLDVGVDLEPRSRAPTIASLGHRVFSPSELQEGTALSSEDWIARALTLWTAKEAYSKARGRGLSLEPRSYSLSISPSGIALVSDPSCDAVESWHFALLDLDAHRIAIALPMAGFVVRLWRIEPLGRVERLGDADASGRSFPPGACAP